MALWDEKDPRWHVSGVIVPKVPCMMNSCSFGHLIRCQVLNFATPTSQVEHREDGKNVNGWHWTTTSKLGWAKERLGELFLDLPADLDVDKGTLKVTGVKQVTGEVKSGRDGAERGSCRSVQ